MSHASADAPFQPLDIAVLTVSDTRSLDNDQSGDTLEQRLCNAGHLLSERVLVKDDVYAIREVVSRWIASDQVAVILVTGGTGFSSRDNTPEALMPLFDKTVEGYGELFRHLSLASIGTSTIQSRAVAGLANRTLISAMPGAPRACALAWDEIIGPQLDLRHRPCNFVDLLQQHPRSTCGSRSIAGAA
ncbi:molybdenum cofactor biosynthesis protein B [Marinobacter sp. CHS3-4]|uniref:molybdenum cofactor biosynthesis protein B n=1 Tax=Marinobacter sp. CHS3-4 TaxID=3045174 RepID=UPI0024B63618|nr:molybdenum cofactor biosynthesis protein B [Marinobacter sp. CHS3-4]MDI9244135.1 molybdenum cofactor biosynthesis protein B [Marinobacter sp. CHS3-4]